MRYKVYGLVFNTLQLTITVCSACFKGYTRWKEDRGRMMGQGHQRWEIPNWTWLARALDAYTWTFLYLSLPFGSEFSTP